MKGNKSFSIRGLNWKEKYFFKKKEKKIKDQIENK